MFSFESRTYIYESLKIKCKSQENIEQENEIYFICIYFIFKNKDTFLVAPLPPLLLTLEELNNL